MNTTIAQFVVMLVLSALVGGAIACSGQTENIAINELTTALNDIPDDVTTRYVLMVSTDEDGQASPVTVTTVVDVLHDGGADKVEPLQRSPIIFVTSKTAAIYKAIETGLLSSVQVDKLSKPQ